MDITKREFLKGGATAAAGAALASLGGQGVADAAAESQVSGSAHKTILQRIEDLEAEREIRFKIASYPRACDRLDIELAATLFAPDSYVDYGTNPITGQVIYKGTGAGLMEWLHGVDSGLYARGSDFVHIACQMFIEVTGSVAASETYGYAIVMSPGQNGSPNTASIDYARYLDRWERRNGDWLIVRRVVTSDGGFTVATAGPLYPRYNFATDMTDPSYDILNIFGQNHRVISMHAGRSR